MPAPVLSAPSPLSDLAILMKALDCLLTKACPLFSGDKPIGYKVPLREFKRVRAKHRKLRESALLVAAEKREELNRG
jgi:hypothetical protein